MKSKLLAQQAEKTYVLVFDSGEEAMAGLRRFAAENELTAAHFTAIGAFQSVTLGYFDLEKKDYEKLPVHEQVEVLSLVGNVAVHQGKPKLHAHVVVGRRDGSTRGGHLIEGQVRPTLEVMLVESPVHLRRKVDETTGLPLIDPDATCLPPRRGREVDEECP